MNIATLYTLTVPLGSRPYCALWHSVPVGWKKPGVVAYVYQSPRYCEVNREPYSYCLMINIIQRYIGKMQDIALETERN